MEKLIFTITISAPRERVWKALWDDANYRRWTAVFTEGSYAESDWKEGSKIKFLSPGGSGMVSRIARLVPNEFMSFEHLGEIKEGVEDLSAGWSGLFENYALRETDGGTELTATIDMDGESADYFKGIFPKGLAVVKEIAEV